METRTRFDFFEECERARERFPRVATFSSLEIVTPTILRAAPLPGDRKVVPVIRIYHDPFEQTGHEDPRGASSCCNVRRVHAAAHSFEREQSAPVRR